MKTAGAVAEWLGRGLQSPVQRFKSAPRLFERNAASEGSVSGSDAALRVSQAHHVREAAPDEANGAAEASEQRGSRLRRKGLIEILHVHEVRANGADSLEIL